MTDIAVRVDRIGKQYRIGGPAEPYATLRDRLSQLCRRPRRNTAADDLVFWALRDVSFEVQAGTVVGIIGRNGAGKSTLLKILARITTPTEGVADLHGRVGSLLEVGTGFHQELTGRENIFLNGAILGMRKRDIRASFDEIVAFAEVERFLDTPIKHYSSGMHMRLAFAVAAHLQPEILIIDEVLAVGDATFQQKCLGKMQAVSREGRTVLFVSHNLQAVSSLCNRGVHLHAGRVQVAGSCAEAVGSYLSSIASEYAVAWTGDEGDDAVRLVETSVQGGTTGNFRTDEPLHVSLTYVVRTSLLGLVRGVEIRNQHHERLVYSAVDDNTASPPSLVAPGEYTWELTIPPNTFAAGRYHLFFDIGIHNVRRIIHDAGSLSFRMENVAGIGRRFQAVDNVVRPAWEWKSVQDARVNRP